MSTLISWIKYNRPDVSWLKGPDLNGIYTWDNTLPNQEEITQLILDFDPIWAPPPTIPDSVTPRQIRTALVMSGITLSTIDAALDSLPEPDKSVAKISWEFSNEVQRNNPLINSMAPALGLTAQQIDDLFILAATL